MEMKLRFALPQVDTHAHILRLLTEVLNEKKLERGAKMALVVDCWTRSPKELSAIIYYSELVASPLPQDGWSSLSSMASKVHSHSQRLSLRVASKRTTSFCRSKFQKKKNFNIEVTLHCSGVIFRIVPGTPHHTDWGTPSLLCT